MTVAELITALQALPPNAVVNVGTADPMDYYASFMYTSENVQAIVSALDGNCYIDANLL